MPHRLVILGRSDDTTRALYHRLGSRFDVPLVILEEKVPARVVFRRRCRNLGLVPAIGQALFVLLAQPALARAARGRIETLKRACDLPDHPLPPERVYHTTSVNDPSVPARVREAGATHVIVNGTRLLSRATLEAIDVPIINLHLGWNPRYRGGNGAYWALAEGDPEHAGVTVHLIDEGIDTGGVLARARIAPTHDDSFATYPWLQLAAGIDALTTLLQQGTLPTPLDTSSEPSGMWYHPTLWGYLGRRVRLGVK